MHATINAYALGVQAGKATGRDHRIPANQGSTAQPISAVSDDGGASTFPS
jgi:hypothetical protein